ncbi:protein ROOT HAIR DEFECTIVE 3 homolog 2-like [Alnus glutinosa]|uniref:protein ROOT HAIR DEFECTIVE 3 homolog 2-like n=1 Tax=Alnus glutinosa TaxID=3517 RepID=UPI002D778CA3|nr:protein ROOT HAIR DEFECTIVE 3 homolog 2-like [Alnus glutinosa]
MKVEITALSNYEEKEEKFKEEVAQLRQRFFHSISPGGLAGDRRGVVPASVFSFSAQLIWKVIKENKDLDLPAHKVMVATVRCEEIANEKLSRLTSDKAWLALEEAIQAAPVSSFGKQLSSILEKYFSEYDMETEYYDEGVRNAKRRQLESKALDFVHPAFTTLLGHLRSKALESFKSRLEQSLNKGEGFATSVRTCTHSCLLEFDQGCADATISQANWDASKVSDELQRHIDVHASSVRSAELLKMIASYEEQLNLALTKPVESSLEAGQTDTWASIRELLKGETQVAIAKLSTNIAGFELDQATVDKKVQKLRDYGRDLVEKKAREKAGEVLIRMKARFSTVFKKDNGKDALSASLKLLSVMAAIRLDEKPDKIEELLFSSLMDGAVALPSSEDGSIRAPTNGLASSTWEEVSPKDTLITLEQCASLWREFKAWAEDKIREAEKIMEAEKRKKEKLQIDYSFWDDSADVASTFSWVLTAYHPDIDDLSRRNGSD